MKILSIDTSCDDTSVAIAEDLKILSHKQWSKVKLHSRWGGVVPNEAKRQHKEFLDPVINEVLKESKLKLEDIDYFAVTQGPGLALALEAGIAKAKELAIKYNKPLIAVNHMIGHIYSILSDDENFTFKFPALALTVSGGHTDLYLMKDHLKFEHIGWTLDDAVGESFDKVGRMLGFGFPAGKDIEEAAKSGDSKKYDFPRPMINSGDYKWSFSGLKTAVLYQIKKLLGEYEHKPEKKVYKLNDQSNNLSSEQIADIAASFQQAAIESVIYKLKKAIEEYQPKIAVIGGGVIANTLFREMLEQIENETGISIHYPKPIWLCTDNAAMIATAAYFYIKENKFVENINELERIPNLEI